MFKTDYPLPKFRDHRIGSIFAVALLALPLSAQSAIDTWNGGAGGFTNWQNTSNWSGGTIPSSGDTLHFASGSYTTITNDFADATSFSGLIQDSGAPGFTLTGSRLLLSGTIANYSSNTFTLQFSNSWGEVMEITGNTSINAASGNIVIAPTSSGGLVSLNFGTTTTIDCGSGFSVTIANNLNDNGALIVNTGKLILSGSGQGFGWGSQVTVNNGATLQLLANSGNISSGTAMVLGGNNLQLNSGATVDLRSDSSVTFNGGNSIAGLGNASITVNADQATSSGSNQTLTFAPGGFDTYNTTINVTGSHGYAVAIGSINNGYETALTLNAASANLTIGAIGSSNAVSDLNITGSANTTITGAINASGSVIKSGVGKLILTGTSSYSGITTVSGGELDVNGKLSGNGAVTVGTATLGGSGSIAGAVTITGGTVSGNNLSLGSTLSFAGNSTLSGTNTVSGAITINSGTTAFSGHTTGALSVALGATLAGQNGVLTGSMDVTGTLKGSATTSDNLTIESGAKVSMLLDSLSGYDKIVVGSNVSLAGTLNLVLNGLTDGDSYTLILNNGSSAISGTFDAITISGSTVVVSGNTFSVNGEIYTLSYSGGDGNDLTLSVVPEPSTYSLLIGATGMLFLMRRRSRMQ